MKKNLCIVFLALALLIGILAFTVSAAEENSTLPVYISETDTMQHCLCGNHFVSDAEGTECYRTTADGCTEGCDGTLLTWTAWKNAAALPITAGNYYLADNITVTATQTISAAANIGLDLNGKTVSCTAGGSVRIYRVNNSGAALSITDSEGSGTVIRSGSVTAQGTLLWVSAGRLNIYGGTLDASGLSGTSNAPVDVTTKCYLYGGKIIGGTTTTNGGAIRLSGSTTVMEMYGGEVVGGTAANGGTIYNAGTLTVNGGKILSGTATAEGAAICTVKTLNINGGEILRGDATANKALISQLTAAAAVTTVNGGTIDGGAPTGAQNGAIKCSAGTLNLNDGEVMTSAQHVIYLYNATMNAAGGSISGGTIGINVNGNTNGGGSTVNISGTDVGKTVYLNGTAPSTVTMTAGEVGTFNMAGANGTVNLSGGDVSAITYTAGTLNVSGNPQVSGAGVTLGEGKVMTVGELTDGAQIKINVEDGVFGTSDAALAEANAAYFLVEGDRCVVADGTDLKVAAAYVATCDASGVQQQKFGDLASAQKALDKNGYVIVLQDVEVNFTASDDLLLDLNGHTVSGTVDMGAYTLSGMDNTTNGYTVGTGKLTAAVTGKVATHCKAPNAKRYLATKNDGVYTFDRFYVGVTAVALNPYSGEIGYKGMVGGNENVKAALAENGAFGFRLNAEGFSPVETTAEKSEFVTGSAGNPKSLTIENQLEAINEQPELSEVPVNAVVFIKLADGTVIESAQYSYTLGAMFKIVDNSFDTMPAGAKSSVKKLYDKYEVMKTWDLTHIGGYAD